MSKIIATKAIRGAHTLVGRAEKELLEAVEEKGPDTRVEFPNTAYYLPISHGMLGMCIETLGGLKELLSQAKKLLPPVPDDALWLPYLGNALDAGMAALFADEIIEAVKYTRDPLPYLPALNPDNGRLWLGAKRRHSERTGDRICRWNRSRVRRVCGLLPEQRNGCRDCPGIAGEKSLRFYVRGQRRQIHGASAAGGGH